MPSKKIKQRIRMRELREKRRNPDLPKREGKRLPGRRVGQEKLEELVRRYIEGKEGKVATGRIRGNIMRLLVERYKWEHPDGIDEPTKEEVDARKRRYSDNLGKMLRGWTPKRNLASVNLDIRVRKELWDILDAGALKEGMSIPAYSRKLMMESLTKKTQ